MSEPDPAPGRRTFIVRVREPGAGLVVEDVHRRERVWLSSLAELPELIAGRLDPGVALTTEPEEA